MDDYRIISLPSKMSDVVVNSRLNLGTILNGIGKRDFVVWLNRIEIP